ncbi:MAG: tripartite tricarboxylate transporter substrate binding protein [Burkholderiaceae bacterium]|nr:tripartite tricarboxylate transporter substrate binding protein [Burkholderiaceae bacterium]
MNRRLALAAAFAVLAIPLAQAQAPAWPTKPVRLVVPFTPGGVSDNVARLIAKELQTALGQPVLVDNKPGGGTNIATAEVGRAAPDGHTLLMSTNLVYSNTLLYKNVPYKVEQFTPVAMLFTVPLVLDATKDLPVKNVKELVAYAKSRPGVLNYGTTGAGSTPHMFGEMFKKMSGTEITHVPFKGSVPLLQEMIGGRVHIAFDGMPAALVQHKAGTIRILAVASKERIPQLPDVPTLTEEGYPIVSSSWWGVYAPAGTPRDVVARLNATIRRIQASPEFKAQMASANASAPEDFTPEQYAAFLKRDYEFWRKLIEPMNLQLD